VPGTAPERAYFTDVNRTRLRVWEWGEEGAPVVVCAHGAQDHGRMWDGLAPRVAALGYRVVAPDLRGHGDSGRLASVNIWGATVLDLATVAGQVGGPVGWLGHSFGAGVAMYAAAIWPELTRWVVSLDGVGPPPQAFESRDLVESARAGLDGVRRALDGPPRVYPTREDMVERRLRVNTRLPRQWAEHLVEHGSVMTEGGWTWKADRFMGVGLPGPFDLAYLEAELEALRAPTLVLTGAEHDMWSEMSEPEVAERLTHLVTAEHSVIAGAGHYVHLEQPDAVMSAITEFLGRVGP